MVRTRVGYAGGKTPEPRYHDLGGHSEALQVDFDPSRLSYERLLEVLWSAHRPTRPPWSQQYKSAIFCHDTGQRRAAEESLEREAAHLGQKIYTEILPDTGFWLAEGYHQKYRLRATPELMSEIEAYYSDVEGLVGSTAAARLNGYLGGHGSREQLETEIESLGLSASRMELLRKLTRRLPARVSYNPELADQAETSPDSKPSSKSGGP